MKAIEFNSNLKDKNIKIPDNIDLKISEGENVRVILLFEDYDDDSNNDFKMLAKEKFLEGYSDSDSAYDNY